MTKTTYGRVCLIDLNGNRSEWREGQFALKDGFIAYNVDPLRWKGPLGPVILVVLDAGGVEERGVINPPGAQAEGEHVTLEFGQGALTMNIPSFLAAAMERAS